MRAHDPLQTLLLLLSFPAHHISLLNMILYYILISFYSICCVCSLKVEGMSFFESPSGSPTADSVLIIHTAKGIPKLAYQDLSTSIQSHYRMQVFLIDSVEELNRMELLDNFKDVRVFLMSHSLSSGAAIQRYVFEDRMRFRGLILLGSSVLPEYRQFMERIPILSIHGDLDNVVRLKEPI